jgi:hypothetical protein
MALLEDRTAGLIREQGYRYLVRDTDDLPDRRLKGAGLRRPSPDATFRSVSTFAEQKAALRARV